jgi:hypothetical protein
MSAPVTTRTGSRPMLLNAEPRVQLLPPMVKERERARVAARVGVLFVVLAVVLAGGMYLFGTWRATTAAADLDTANSETQSLLQQQGEFRIATDTATMVGYLQETQRTMTSYEIVWLPFVADLVAVLPKGAAISTFSADSQPPWGVPLGVEDPLAPPRIATVTVGLQSSRESDIVLYQDAIGALPGVASATVTGYDPVEGTTTVVITLTPAATSGRYAGNDQEGWVYVDPLLTAASDLLSDDRDDDEGDE